MTSLPVPDSPWMSTVDSVGATVSARRSTSSQLCCCRRARARRVARARLISCLQRAVLDAQLAMLGGALEDREQLVVAERLLDVVEGAFVHRLHRRLQRRLRRHEDDRACPDPAAAPRRGSPRRRRPACGRRRARCRAAARASCSSPALPPCAVCGVEAGVAQQDAERLENARLVVDDEDGGSAGERSRELTRGVGGGMMADGGARGEA